LVKTAVAGFDKIVEYLKLKWTNKEVTAFIEESDSFFKLLQEFPGILQKTTKRNLHRGPLNRLTIITYRVHEKEHLIQIVNIRSARRKPLKD
jgi:plasmid stabilization system protein ParE